VSELEESEDIKALLLRIARDTKQTRDLMTQFVNAQLDAESEVPERMRRFMTYYHDLHDIKYMHEELGQTPYDYILKELQRCDDRFRHILQDLHDEGTDGKPIGTFSRVRQEMASREGNRWEHGRLLPKGTIDEAGNGTK
jgi:hypothetical protein